MQAGNIIFMKISDFLELVRSPNAAIDGANALKKAGLDELREIVFRAMDELPSDYENKGGDWAVRVWLSDLLIEAAQVIRDQAAGEAEAAGQSPGLIAAALGQKTSTNGRTKAPYWKQFSEARKAVELTGATVDVQAGNFLVHVTPVTPREGN